MSKNKSQISIIESPPNPFALQSDDYSWLDLGTIPEIINDPFYIPVGTPPPDPVEELVRIMSNPDYFYFTCKQLFNIELMPFQCLVLDFFWRKKYPMMIATRGFSKSFMLAVYALLKLVFDPGCKIVICSASYRQSKQVFEYMMNAWENSYVLKDMAGGWKNGGPHRDVDRLDFRIGNSVCTAIPLGSGDKIRGMRANIILCDEFSSIPEEIFNVVVQGFGVVQSSPVQKVKLASTIRKLKASGLWTPEMDAINKIGMGGNQIIYSGTAWYDWNHFARYFKKWHKIIASKGKDLDVFDGEVPEGFNWKDYGIIRVPYKQLPKDYLDEGIVAQARATLNHSQFLREYECIFVSDSDGFFKRSIIEAATANKPIKLTSGEIVQFPALRVGRSDKAYVIGIDPAADRDNAAITVVELNTDHRRIVYCWTTNRKKYTALKKESAKNGVMLEDDYYRYIAKKVRSIMRLFNTEHIIMDSNGGGIAIAEALSSPETCEKNESPIYPIIDREDPQPDDLKTGLHILELISPTQEINADANHGMLKDMQDKVLLFPKFDTVEIAKAIIIDKEQNSHFDSYEEILEEIEELKNEITLIVVTPSSTLGKETFDVPKTKGENTPKGYLRKDRYSSLLYANYYARNRDKKDAFKVEYVASGGTINELRKITPVNESMYHGKGMIAIGPYTSNIGNYQAIKRY